MPEGLYLEIVTAERLVYSGPVTLVSAPGQDGRLGILPGHAPLLAALRPGELRLRPREGEEISLAIGGGFLEVSDNRVVILARSAERAAEIDVERARQARERALQRLRDRHGVDAERARAALARAEARIKVAEKRRTTDGEQGR
ncbi:MAG: F0F1 ATP synthase subunit epsilon [Anaerolineae bacterium]|nr:F0F1 ATP synthase subunit epsilon [Anaerolineae bacterium]